MKRLIKITILLFASFGFHAVLANPQKEKLIKLPDNITGIRSTSNINYHVTVGAGANQLIVTGDPKSLEAIRYSVKQGILHIYYEIKNHDVLKRIFHSKLYNAQINIHLQNLNTINQNGWGSMYVHYYRSEPLVINKAGPGSLIVKGKAIRLSRLKNAGTGNISIVKVYSNGLSVADYGSGKITLLGSHINLRQLIGCNNGDITINNIRSNLLTFNVNNDANIKLTGEFKVAKINYSGSGNMQMYWIKGNNIFINISGSGTLALAGVTKIVNAFAYGRSHLDLRYLRADTAFIRSYDLAAVDVWSNVNLYALADNSSNIYYFNQPIYMTRIMHQSGSILSMADISNAILTFNMRGSNWIV